MTVSSDPEDPVLTCVLITGSPASHGVAAQLRAWSDLELLVPFVVVEMKDVSGVQGGAPLITGHLISKGQPPQLCEVQRLIAHGRWRRVLVLALFDVEAPDGPVADPSLIAATVASELLDAMPIESDLRRAGPRELSAVRVFAPSSDAGVFPQQWAGYHHVWEYSLVLSPEDRQRPDSIADHVRWPGNYASHVAGALAALGGLWFGFNQPGLPAPLESTDSSGPPEPAVQVIRVQNRVAMASLPLEPTIRRAIAVTAGWEPAPAGATQFGLRQASTGASRVLCGRAYSGLRRHESQALRYQPLPPTPPEPELDIAGAELFDNYWRFVFGRRRKERRAGSGFYGALWEPVLAPITAVRRWFDRTVQRTFQGEETGRRFRTAPSLPHEMAVDWVQRWERAAQATALSGRGYDPEADAVFWAQLRSRTLGLVDGQRPDVDPTRVDVIDVVSDRGMIVPGPEVAPLGDATIQLLTGDWEVSGFDANALTLIANELDQAFAARERGEDPDAPADQPPVVAAPERSRPALWIGAGGAALLLGAFALGAGLIAGGLLLLVGGLVAGLVGARRIRRSQSAQPATDDGSANAELFGPPGPSGPAPMLDEQLLRQCDDDVLDELRVDRARIGGWLAEYSGSLVGRISLDLAQDIATATSDDRLFSQAFGELKTPDFSVLAKRRKAWLVWFWVCILGYLGGLYLGTRAYRATSDFSLTIPFLDWEIQKDQVFAGFLAAFTVTVLALFLRAIVRYYKAFEQGRHRLRTHTQQCTMLVHQRDHAHRETARLGQINQRFTKWAEVYSWVLREPFPRDAATARPQSGTAAEAVAPPGGGPESPPLAAPPPSEDEAPPPASVAGEPDSMTVAPTEPEAGVLAAAEPVATPVEPRKADLPGALGTQVARVTSRDVSEGAELRNGVAAVTSRGFMHDCFHSLLRHAFSTYDVNTEDVAREMDRDGRGSVSYLAVFVRELRSGECRSHARDELSGRLARYRAADAQSPGSAFSTMRLPDADDAAVADFLAELSAPGSSIRKGLFGSLAQVEGQHRVSYGRLWTHAGGASPGPGQAQLAITRLSVVPDPEQVQMDAVRVDATAPLHPQRLTCFAPVAAGAPYRRAWDDADSGLV